VSQIETEKHELAAVEADYPGWQAWVGISGTWHARRVGSPLGPGDILDGTGAASLRKAIGQWISENEA
jgi:hypothetical protein